MIRVLHIGADEEQKRRLREWSVKEDRPYRLDFAASEPAALEALRGSEHDLLMVSAPVSAPAKGLFLLEEIAHAAGHRPVLFFCERGQPALGEQALARGAADWLPTGELDDAILERSIRHALERARLAAELHTRDEQIMRSERLAALGALAAGVAHEIRNPLAYMITNLDLLLGERLPRLDALCARTTSSELAGELASAHQLLVSVREGAERVRFVMQDLRSFSRPDEQMRPVDVRTVLESTLRLAQNELRHRAQVIKEYGEAPLVLANPGRLGQVFLNLVVNAAQAIEPGAAGRNELRLRTSSAADGHAMVEISDTGAGIPRDALPHIFDPFFSTKPVGVGMGLGLSICQSIVSAMGGRIEVQSEVGRGSVFRVLLPAAPENEAVAAAAPARTAPAQPVGRRGRVLVIDDEPLVGTSIRHALASEHDVSVTTAARQALDEIQAGDRFDLILCDLMMPELSGVEFYQELSQLAPSQLERVVFLTGGAFTGAAEEFLARVSNPCLEKPFDVPFLVGMVRERIAAMR